MMIKIELKNGAYLIVPENGGQVVLVVGELKKIYASKEAAESEYMRICSMMEGSNDKTG